MTNPQLQPISIQQAAIAVHVEPALATSRRPMSLTNVFLEATAPERIISPTQKKLQQFEQWRSNPAASSVQGEPVDVSGLCPVSNFLLRCLELNGREASPGGSRNRWLCLEKSLLLNFHFTLTFCWVWSSSCGQSGRFQRRRLCPSLMRLILDQFIWSFLFVPPLFILLTREESEASGSWM
ncbi:unnamed protein product [Pleuronectes platessa]|uniref:Uncharacterized protein n=1 Tax=Pleuronectes platessa TaxID=8262 RepID=A0A9N7VY76_PLEPL|nr:unnamed protein product [Pleuronectes platessa]